ncbi:FAD-dependent oxidoreductase [Alcaligenaceae bacterium B3P038]|nr:FAD-dependent oxidoreductase [Alcaligenaceae bacterium B3P038]
MKDDYDVIVCGAGVMGAAIALGLTRLGRRVLALDGNDGDLRAARANFGLLWVQGKGYGKPDYQALSHEAADRWPGFAAELEAQTGVDLQFEQRGGLQFCLGEAQMAARAERIGTWQTQLPSVASCTEMIERSALMRMMPDATLGPDVSGASFCHRDGQINPLKLLRALQSALVAEGGTLIHGAPVSRITPEPGNGFTVQADAQRWRGAKVVIAAGLGSPTLAAMVDLDVPLRPQRGQLLVTERLAPLLPYPASGLRQTGEGTVMIGVTQEDVGMDMNTTTMAAAKMSRKALRILPALSQVGWVRQWSALRIMTPDGAPVYAQSTTHPGAFIALCHSGVTLAPIHAGPLAAAIADGALPLAFNFFHQRRFHVSQAE